MQEKKILITATTFPRWSNDTTPRFVYDLSEKLASRNKVIVLVPHHKGALKHEAMGKLDVRRFAYFIPKSMQKLCYGGGIIPNMRKSFLAKIQMPMLIISEFFSAVSIVRKEKISMVHAHWMLPQGLVGVFLKKLFRIPLIVTIHGSDLFPLRSKFFKSLQNYVVKNTNIITVNTGATKNELVRRFPNNDSKIKMIPMGVNSQMFKKTNLKKPKEYSKNKVLLFVGRLSDQKGLQYLIDSMGDVSRYEPSIKLLIIGEGPYKKKLLQKARNKGIQDHVVFLGSLPAVEVARYHNYADIFVMPSLAIKTGTEALGLSMLEAMSSGNAVIGTDVGGIPFAIKNNFNGLLVKQKDPDELSHAIITLLKDRKKAAKLGKNASQFIRKNYSWDNIAKEFLKLYDGLLR